MSVVIKHDLIEAVAKFAMIDSSRTTRVVNGGGKYLIPGLWDMHVHTASATAWNERSLHALYIANGVTGVRDMDGNTGLLEQRRIHTDRGELFSPHIFAGNALGDNASNLKPMALSTPAVAETFSDETKSIEQLSGVMLACSSNEEELRRQVMRALANHDETAYAALAAEIRATYDPKKAWDLFVHLSDRGTRLVPALIWLQASANLDNLGLRNPGLKDDRRLKYVPAEVRRSWDEGQFSRGVSPAQLAEAKKVAARDVELVNAMHRAGVQFMAGTDSPAPYVIPGFSLHQELEWLVKSGFTPAQALQAATIDPAIFLVNLDKYGVIEKGHIADLVLLNANPLEDIRNTQKIAAVVFGGKYYSREDLDNLLASAEQTDATAK
jgi:imidazolonepropionase-like amidohydrolase